MMEVLMNIWLSLNIVFGVWSARNWIAYTICLFSKRLIFNDTKTGQLLDLVIPASCLAYHFTVSGV